MQDLRFANAQLLAQQLSETLATVLQRRIDQQGRVALAVSGGRTPVAMFEQLSRQDIDWRNVIITLVDERWVDNRHEASNERLVREHLLKNYASIAWFVPLKTPALKVQDGFMDCENRLHEQISQLDYALLGMGNDGHTASWFPHSQALPSVLSETANARSAPVLDAPLYPRITLTWSFLAQCRQLFLHFEGEDKNTTFAKACQSAQSTDIAAMPVRQLLTQTQVPLSLYRTY